MEAVRNRSLLLLNGADSTEPLSLPRQDEEARVRGAVAECVRVLAQKQGTAVFDAMGQQITHSIQAAFVSVSAFFDRSRISTAQCSKETRTTVLILHGGLQARDPVAADSGPDSHAVTAQRDFLGQLLQSSYRRQRPGQGELRHDTEGWRSLESSFRALQVLTPSLCLVPHVKARCILHYEQLNLVPSSPWADTTFGTCATQALIEGCGPASMPYLTAELRRLILDSMLHQNRLGPGQAN